MRLSAVIFIICILVESVLAGECKEIIYSANPAYPPFHWEQDGKLKGASIEMVERIAKKINVKIKPVVYPWNRVLKMAELGEIDLVLSLKKTPEREQFLSFTKEASFPNPMAVFVRKDEIISFKEWSDLKSYPGLFSLGDKFGGGFDEYKAKELRFSESATMEENFKKLAEEKVHRYFVTGKYVGLAHLQKVGMSDKIIALEKNLNEGEIHFGFSKKSKCVEWADKFSDVIKSDFNGSKKIDLLKKYLK